MKSLSLLLCIVSVSFPFDFSLYLTNEELEATTDLLAWNPLVKKRSCSNEKKIHYLELGNAEKAPYLGILECNIHARQIITADICIQWVKNKLQNNPSLFSTIAFLVMYDANLMREAVFKSNPFVRKNINGVDLNRNFPTEWNFYHMGPDSQIYGGEQPIDQPYTICLEKLLQERTPDIFLDLHSGENGALFYQSGVNNYQELTILDKINEEVCEGKCRVTSLRKDGEAINGHIFADLKVRMQVPVSFLFQVYGNDHPSSILGFFNPSTAVEKKYIMDKWEKAINLVIDSYVPL